MEVLERKGRGRDNFGWAVVGWPVERVRRRSVHTREWAGRVDARYITQCDKTCRRQVDVSGAVTKTHRKDILLVGLHLQTSDDMEGDTIKLRGEGRKRVNGSVRGD